MNRLVAAEFREAIGNAMGVIPAPILSRLQHVHFFTGTDATWAGLEEFEEVGDGRSYRDTAHCSYPWHTYDHTTTIVMPILLEPFEIVHEMGHALDQTLGFAHSASPVTDYARTNRYEAFAEVFVASLYRYGDQDAYAADLATRRLFGALAGAN